MSKIIAVDFDGCLVTSRFPEIGDEIPTTVHKLQAEKDKGARLILWTCRYGDRLIDAVEWCSARGIQFDSVNENLPDVIESFGGDTRKIFADEYWDDRAVRTPCDD